MKTKTWAVITNTGQQADSKSGLETKEFNKPTHISCKECVYWFASDRSLDGDSLRMLFNL